MRETTKVIFLHFEATGGSSVEETLNTAGVKVARIDAPEPFNIMRDLLANRNVCFDDTELISGHHAYGCHLPLVNRMDEPEVEFEYITILREPIIRLIIWYKWFRDIYKDWKLPSDVAEGCLKHRGFNNYYIRTLVGNIRQEYRCDLAFEILRTFEIIGFTDELSDFCDEVGRCYHWPMELTAHKGFEWNEIGEEYYENVGEDRLNILRGLNTSDIELYNRVRREL